MDAWVLKALGAAGDISTVLIIFYVYVSGQKIKDWVRGELKEIHNAVLIIQTKMNVGKDKS